MKQKFCSLFLVGMFLLLGNNVYAESSNISALIFTTDIQTIKPGVVSKEIIVQTQNGTGMAEPVSETNDVTFLSSSATGEFLNSSGNAVTKTMSKNTSSRTFYYRDSTLGSPSITVSVKGRDSGKVFSASQKITISKDSVGGTDATTTTATSTTVSAATSTEVVNVIEKPALSAHASTISISYVEPSLNLKADAGRQRIGTVGNPIEFDAKTSDLFTYYGKANYVWNFGDGSSESNKKVEHTYLFPGKYIVVLNVDAGENHAVSRTEVTIVQSEVDIETVSREKGFIELRNNSAYEVNIGRWRMVLGKSVLVFPDDTLIASKSSVKFPTKFIEGDGEVIVLMNSNGTVSSQYSGSQGNSITEGYQEPVPEETQGVKIKVTDRFKDEQPKVTQGIGDGDVLNPHNATKENESFASSTTPLIKSVTEKGPGTNRSFLAVPVGIFHFLSNFFTK